MVSQPIPAERGEGSRLVRSAGTDSRRICTIEEALGRLLGPKSPQELFCELLGYLPAEGAIFTGGCSHQERGPLATDPKLFATAGTGGALHLLHVRLAGHHLQPNGARPTIQWLLREHPLSLIVITVEGAEGWQLVWGLPCAGNGAKILRRITLDPSGSLRGVAGRIALLDLSRLRIEPADADAESLRGLVQEAFDLEALRRTFLKTHHIQLGLVERSLAGTNDTPHQRRELALRLLRRLMVEAFVRCTGRLGDLAGELLVAGSGLRSDDIIDADVESEVRRALVDAFPFTAVEGALADREVAIDPEMLGITYEGKAPGRREKGSFYILFANGRDRETDGYGSGRLSTEGAVSVSSREYASGFGAIFFEPTPENRWLFDVLLARPPSVGSGGREFLLLGEVAPALDTGIHSGNVRRRLFFAERPSDRPLPRLLQGTQVLPYGVWWDNPGARYSYVDVHYLPDRARMGIGRGGRPSGRNEYWRFSGAPENHMVVDRLLLRQTADEPVAGYIRQGNEVVYTDNTLHTLLLAEEGIQRGLTYGYLLALLNSATLRWIYRAIAQEPGRTLPQVKTGLVKRLPIALPRAGEQRELEALVAEIQAIQVDAGSPLSPEAEGRTSALQGQIDQKVRALYGF